jgi:hypothetical protein
MGYHTFSLDPRMVLGVAASATMDEIHEAYRAKSKKHHPDLGGDEWAFRMVARAYEVLTTTMSTAGSRPWTGDAVDSDRWRTTTGWTWGNQEGSWRKSGSSDASAPAGVRVEDCDARACPGGADSGSSTPDLAEQATVDPARFQTVDVELIWIRFEREVPGRLGSADANNEATLSVCMVVSWPPEELVERAVEYEAASEVLYTVIDQFETLRVQASVGAGRSRIEDGQFVGWLSYGNVLSAQDAFVDLRRALETRGLTIRLQTRDERVPYDWYGRARKPVMSHAS